MEIDNVIALGVFKSFRNRNEHFFENTSVSSSMAINLGKEGGPTEVKTLILIVDSNQWMSIQLGIPLGIH